MAMDAASRSALGPTRLDGRAELRNQVASVVDGSETFAVDGAAKQR